MTGEVNEGVVGDTAKLMMHRLIARILRRAPSLVERARIAHARQADKFAGWPFVREWEELLALPTRELASKLTNRDREMVRLRNSSPFYLTEGVNVGDHDALRLRDVRQLRGGPGQLLRMSLVEFVWHRQRAAGPDIGVEHGVAPKFHRLGLQGHFLSIRCRPIRR